MDYARQLASLFVLPVVVQQLGEDGEVETGEDEADGLESDLPDLLGVGGRTEFSLDQARDLTEP